jgi:hypothetical protein
MLRRCAPVLLFLPGLLVLVPASRAQTDLGPVTVGAGLRTNFVATLPAVGNNTNQFSLDDIRLYVNGNVTDDIKFMFNTDYNGATNTADILDAVARIEISPEFNIWAGRLLPPSDRANLSGPFFANEWLPFTDGVQDGYPSVFQGRDNGVVYWGTFAKKVKVSAGAFDGMSADGNASIIWAGRVQIDFWDPEDGYYLNRTYYGDKNLLAIGGATQVQDGHTGTTADFLLERKVGNGGAFTIESEYSDYNRLGGYNILYAKSQGAYILGAYMFPKPLAMAGKFAGKFQILGKFARADFTRGTTANYRQNTAEYNLNYIIKPFNAMIQAFAQDERFNGQKSNFWQAGIGLQIQM